MELGFLSTDLHKLAAQLVPNQRLPVDIVWHFPFAIKTHRTANNGKNNNEITELIII